jgi:hypothetical protein
MFFKNISEFNIKIAIDKASSELIMPISWKVSQNRITIILNSSYTYGQVFTYKKYFHEMCTEFSITNNYLLTTLKYCITNIYNKITFR